MTYDKIKVDENKLKRLQLKIYNVERENFKTKKKSNTQMVELLIKLVREETNNVN